MKRRWRRRLIVLAAVLLMIGLFMHMRINPLTQALAVAKLDDLASNILAEAIHREIAKNEIEYSDLISLERNSQGDVTALRTNMQEINLLKAHIMVSLEDDMYSLGTSTLGIPLGNLTGISVLSGRGPKIPVKVLSVSSSDAEFYGEFADAGINQTIHRLVMRVSLDLVLLLPGGTVSDSVSTDVCVAETVLLGQVPQWYQYNDYEKEE